MTIYIGLVGAFVTLTIFAATVIWKAAFLLGQQDQRIAALEAWQERQPARERVEALEAWRLRMRDDMREVSNGMETERLERVKLDTRFEERLPRGRS